MNRLSHTSSIRWLEDPTTLDLLAAGGPFSSPEFRAALAAGSTWTDCSFGARLEDGTRAAIPLMKRIGVGVSMPLGYGEVAADRALSERERGAFLDAARKARGLRRLILRQLGIEPSYSEVSIVDLVPGIDPTEAYSKVVRRALRQAPEIGLSTRRATDPEPFIELYASASRAWETQYDPDLLRDLVRSNAARVYEVCLDDRPVGGALALVGADHWMYWVGAQDDDGRRLQSGYLAVPALIDDAWRSGARFVNLGASVAGGKELSGVAFFKSRFKGRPIAVGEVLSAGVLGTAEHALHERWRHRSDRS